MTKKQEERLSRFLEKTLTDIFTKLFSSDPTGEELISRELAAEKLGMALNTFDHNVSRMIKNGLQKVTITGSKRSVKFRRASVDALIAKSANTSTPLLETIITKADIDAYLEKRRKLSDRK